MSPRPSAASPRPNCFDESGAPVRRVLIPIDPERDELPATVVLEERRFFVTRYRGGFRLLSTVCPHAGGRVFDVGSRLECPNHGWRFDRESGECINTPSQRLSAIPVEVVDGRLYADVPPGVPVRRTRPTHTQRALRGVSVTLHAHACLGLSYGGFHLVTDPWIDGPAFLGSWVHYPPPLVHSEDLRPDAIFISHDHSDHFHEPTLQRLDKATPVYVPDFPNRQLAQRCRRLGFTSVRPVLFGERVELSPGVYITCFEPASLWNDSIVLVELGGLRLLNLNDAGINRRIAEYVAPVHVVASSFSQRASSYPAVWRHLSDSEKATIIERGEQGALEMLRVAVETYGASHVLPFATHFTLWHPTHREYVRDTRVNHVGDVVRAFAETEVEVIDLLPGERFDGNAGAVAVRRPDRDLFADDHHAMRYIEEHFDPEEFAAHHPVDENVSREEVERWLLSLNETTEMAFSEEMVTTLRGTTLTGEPIGPEVHFCITAGRLALLDDAPTQPNLQMDVPVGVLGHMIRNRLPFDEADIGYWPRFHRAPDIFHAGFWRLIHSPYFARPAGELIGDGGTIDRTTVIAALLEQHGLPADRLLRRYGLFCVGCRHSTAETIEIGGRQHGIEEEAIDRLVRELQVAVG